MARQANCKKLFPEPRRSNDDDDDDVSDIHSEVMEAADAQTPDLLPQKTAMKDNCEKLN